MALKILDGQPDGFARYATHLSRLWPELPVAMRGIQRDMVGWQQIAGMREQPSVWISLHDAEVVAFESEVESRGCQLACLADDGGEAIPVTLVYRGVTAVEGEFPAVVGQTVLYHEVDVNASDGWVHRLELSNGVCIEIAFADVSLIIDPLSPAPYRR